MAEIYLNPQSKVNWATDQDSDADTQPVGEALDSVKAAVTLLKQLQPSDMQISKYKVRGIWPKTTGGHQSGQAHMMLLMLVITIASLVPD